MICGYWFNLYCSCSPNNIRFRKINTVSYDSSFGFRTFSEYISVFPYFEMYVFVKIQPLTKLTTRIKDPRYHTSCSKKSNNAGSKWRRCMSPSGRPHSPQDHPKWVITHRRSPHWWKTRCFLVYFVKNWRKRRPRKRGQKTRKYWQRETQSEQCIFFLEAGILAGVWARKRGRVWP